MTSPAGVTGDRPAPEPRSVAKDARTVALLTLAARVVGFLRWLVFAATVGAAGVGTVYQSVNAVPNVVYEIAAGGVLAAVVVPLLAGRVERGAADVDQVASALLTRAIAVLLPVSLVVAVLAPWISRQLLGHLDVPGAVALGTHLLWLFVPQVLLYGLGVVVTGVLHAHRRFVAAALAPLLSSLVVIATYLGYALLVRRGTSPDELPVAGLLVLGLGTTAGVVALSAPLLVAARRAGIRLRPTWALAPELVRRAATLAAAGLVALVAQQVAVVVTLTVANRSGGDGTVVVQQYVQALYLLPYALLAVPVATAAFPAFAGAASDEGGEPEGARPPVDPRTSATVAGALRAVLLLAATAAAVLVVVAGCIGVVFDELDAGRGSGAGPALGAMPAALRAWAPGLLGLAVAAVATRALYVRGRARSAGLAVAAGWVVAAVVPLVLLGPGDGPVRTLQVLGWSSSAGMTLSALVLVSLLAAGWGHGALERLGPATIAGVALVAGSFAVAGLLDGRTPDGASAALLAGTGIAAGTAALCVAVVAAVEPTVAGRLASSVRRGRR